MFAPSVVAPQINYRKMNRFIKNTLLLGVLGATLVSCKKDEDSPSNDTAITDQVLNGVLKGKITGNTRDDSTAFSFNYLFPYEYGWNYSWWEDNGNGTVDIYVERYKDDDYDTYAYIEIDNWDPSTPLSTASYEIYMEDYFRLENGKTLNYWGGADDGDNGGNITVDDISLNQNTGKFTISLTIDFVETTQNNSKVSGASYTYNSTYNPGKMTMQYSGTLLSDDVISKRGQ